MTEGSGHPGPAPRGPGRTVSDRPPSGAPEAGSDAEIALGALVVRVRRAGDGDVDEVLSVLDEAVGWLAGRGIEQWPARFERGWLEGPVRRGESWLAESGGRALGTLQLSSSDPIWEDRPGAARYLHRLAVRREAAGLGRLLVGWAAGESARAGCALLRLDCVADNAAVRRYYEGLGFAHAGDVEVRGPPGDRSAEWPPVTVSRYELEVTASGLTAP